MDLERDSIDELNLTEGLRMVKTASGKTATRHEGHVTNPIVFPAGAGQRPSWAKPQPALPSSLMPNLDEFITHKLPLPEPLATSAEIQDRQSIFLAYIFRASTPKQAHDTHSHVRRVTHAKRPATHEIMAWRCMVLKDGRTGLRGEDDFEVEEGSEDDGEQWAGGHVLKVMRSEAIMDAVVIVSRW